MLKNNIGRQEAMIEIPMSLSSLIAQDHIARSIVEFVYLFDLSSIAETYSKNKGRKGYDIYSMFAVIIYAYTQGIYSSRAIEKQCRENVVFMWIMQLESPDHSTIHRFQQRIIGKEESLNAEQVKILLKKELIDLANVSIDGTKIRSVANKYTNVYRGTVGYRERQMEEKIATAISSASDAIENMEEYKTTNSTHDSNSNDDSEPNDTTQADNSTDCDDREQSSEQRNHVNKCDAITEIPDEIKKISKIDIHTEKQSPSKNMNKRYTPQIELDGIMKIVKWLITLTPEQIKSNTEINKLTKEIDGIFLRKLKYIEQRDKLGNRNSYSKTDEDASFMRLKNDSFDCKILSPAYNVHQANCNGFMLHYSVTNLAADTRQLPDFVKTLIRIGALQEHSYLLADAGYGSLENYKFLEENSINHLIPYMSQRFESKRKFLTNPVHPSKFVFINKSHAICPAMQILDYTYTKKTVSPSGFTTYKDMYLNENCEGCVFASRCSKNGKTRLVTNDVEWELQKRKIKQKFSEEENIERYKIRTIIEHGFAQVKFNNKLERFRNYGIKMNTAILTLLGIACNIKRMHNVNGILKTINISIEKMNFTNTKVKFIFYVSSSEYFL